MSAPRAPPETIDSAQAAVAIAIETSRFVIDGYAGVQMKLVNRIVVVDATGVQADWLVRCEAPTILTENTILNAPDFAVVRRTPLKQYTEMVRDLSALLTRRDRVFYDQDAVLDALRFGLPLERTTDVGHVMHLRNDALRRGGTCWCRTRRQLVGLDALWGPLIGGRIPADPIARAEGLLRMFDRVAVSIPKPEVRRVNAWTPPQEWYSRPERLRELSASLAMEKRAGGFDERVRRAHDTVAIRLPEPRYASSPFHRANGLEPSRLEVVNRLMRIVPHHGLALLSLLTERGFVTEAARDEFRRTQTRRHLESDTSSHVFELVVHAPNRNAQRAFYSTIVFLAMDDDTLWTRARTMEFPEFE